MRQGRLFSAVAIFALVAVGCGIFTGPDETGRLSIQRFTASPDQIVVVTTSDWSSVSAGAQLFEKKDDRAEWKAVGDKFPQHR